MYIAIKVYSINLFDRLMQGWLFVHSAYFWTVERVKAFLTSVPIVNI
jgi:hypothetical protein